MICPIDLMQNYRRLAALAFFVSCVSRLSGAEQPTPAFAAKLAPVPPAPALVLAAGTNQVVLEKIDPPSSDATLNPGDSVTALVTLFEKNNRRTQWATAVTALPPESAQKPTKPTRPMVLYSSLGNRLEFTSAPVRAHLQMLGPFAASDSKKKTHKPKFETEKIDLDKDFLGLGLDRAAAASFRLKQLKSKDLFTFEEKPFSAKEISEAKQLATKLQFTSDEERAMAGAIPAMLSYFKIIGEIPGLTDIFLKVVDLPSTWSIIWHAGVRVNMEFLRDQVGPADLAAWGLPGNEPVYYFPMSFSINDHHALDLTFLVTAPHPPMLECGGIVGLLAENPADKENYLTLRVISAHHSAAK
jgi:hypothetical protein